MTKRIEAVTKRIKAVASLVGLLFGVERIFAIVEFGPFFLFNKEKKLYFSCRKIKSENKFVDCFFPTLIAEDLFGRGDVNELLLSGFFLGTIAKLVRMPLVGQLSVCLHDGFLVGASLYSKYFIIVSLFALLDEFVYAVVALVCSLTLF